MQQRFVELYYVNAIHINKPQYHRLPRIIFGIKLFCSTFKTDLIFYYFPNLQTHNLAFNVAMTMLQQGYVFLWQCSFVAIK